MGLRDTSEVDGIATWLMLGQFTPRPDTSGERLMCMKVLSACLVPEEARRGRHIPWDWSLLAVVGCQPTVGCCEPNGGPLQEQQVHLTPGASL